MRGNGLAGSVPAAHLRALTGSSRALAGETVGVWGFARKKNVVGRVLVASERYGGQKELIPLFSAGVLRTPTVLYHASRAITVHPGGCRRHPVPPST